MHPTSGQLDDDQLTAEPKLPETGLFGDIPRSIWTLFLSVWALLFGLFAIFFTTNGPATLAVLTACFFAAVILGLPAALGAQSKSAPRSWPRVIGTRTGPLPTRAAAVQILLIPAGAVIGLTAFILLVL